MKVKEVGDGWDLYPETPVDRRMIKELWNRSHPKLQIRRVEEGAKLGISVRFSPPRIFVYSGYKKSAIHAVPTEIV